MTDTRSFVTGLPFVKRNAMPIALQVDDVAAARQRLEAEGVQFVGASHRAAVPRRMRPVRNRSQSVGELREAQGDTRHRRFAAPCSGYPPG